MDTTNKINASSVFGSTPKSVPLTQAFLYWLKLGFISLGGPAGQISIMHHDLVDKKRLDIRKAIPTCT